MNIQAFGLVWYPDDSEGRWYSTITDGYFETISSAWSSNSVASIVSILVQAGVSDAAPCDNFRPLLERALAASKAKAKASGGET